VEIEIDGTRANTARFLALIRTEAPPAARIDEVKICESRKRHREEFSIRESKASEGFTQISPDIATCADCLEEMEDPADRRYRFPFINCTNCGPRYSIIANTPYDRYETSMNKFTMCRDCESEFHAVGDRRFHAQPDCCSICGPSYTLFSIAGKRINCDEPILETAELLKRGHITAVKGIGGFHIACDATSCIAVNRLRKLKRRPTKPLAIMATIDNLDQIVKVNRNERKLLVSPLAPIMLLRKRSNAICAGVAPKNPYLGVMLPYTPVHYLLLKEVPYLVMTSANIQDEPVAKDAQDITRKMHAMVSFYLNHNRKIENRCDDSIGYYLPGKGFSIIRRSRGYAPIPVDLPIKVKPTLAVGPYLKNTFALANGREAYISPHIGDLDNHETMVFFREMLDKYERWFHINPRLIVHDLHPDYLSTKIAKALPGKKLGVQHHIAHFVSCLSENRVFDEAIGIIFDGTGFGSDGRIWGGECFMGNLHFQQRVAHLEYLPLPGGESSIRKPYRIAIAYTYKLLDIDPHLASSSETQVIHKMVDNNQDLVYTSSMGRLFDCVSAMLGVTTEITYEAEAAINLEYVAASGLRAQYPYQITGSAPMVIGVNDTLAAIAKDLQHGVSNSSISAKFHNTVSSFSYDVACRLRKDRGLTRVCLSGGVFQNRRLLTQMIKRFESGGFQVYTHHQLPNNDGCISYGQVVAGNAR
jgi:hydrogenase maturation protein HypF